MLRFAISATRKRNSALSRVPEDCRPTTTICTTTRSARVGRRYRTDGHPQVQRDIENIGPTRTPDFLERLRRQAKMPASKETPHSATKSSNNAPQMIKRYDSSKLENLLKQGPASKGAARHPTIKQRFPLSNSATRSNLQGSTQSGAGSAALVDFFQKRLAEVNGATEENPPKVNRPTFRGALRSSTRPPVHRANPPIQRLSPIRKRQPINQGGLQAAGAEARMAQKIAVDRQPTSLKSPLGGYINEHLNNNLSSVNIASSSKSENKAESMSPISQFIMEIKKKNRQKEEANAKGKTSDELHIPSWRKSAEKLKNFREQESVDPLFSTPPSYAQDEPEDVQLNPYQLHVAGKEVKPEAPRIVKPRIVTLPSYDVTIKELSPILGLKVDKLMKCLRELGEAPKNDDAYTIDVDVVEMIAMELDILFERPKRRQKTDINDHKQLMERRKAIEEGAGDLPDTETESNNYEKLARRPPVVCIMGHVDHGKTTLMDSLRRLARGGGDKEKKKSKKSKKGGKKAKTVKEDVAGTEAGGITQVISAFQVPLGDQKESLTFLDTPGHAAFSSMRQSGSHAADVIVLVIAADDGVSPQTVEILNFYKSIVKDSDGGIAMVVAMNKIDKPGIDVSESQRRIENELLENGVIPEGVASDGEYGSPVQFFPISAKTGEGVDDLVEGLSLQSEVMDLRADETARAEGIVMDSRVEQGLGVVVDCIVRWGSIKQGDVVVSGTDTGKVRILKDVNNKSIETGTPSQPVRLVGFKTPPKAGAPIVCVASEQIAEDLVARRLAIQNKKRSQEGSGDPISHFSQVIISGRESMTATGTEKKLEKFDLSLEDTGPIRIPIVVKAKADGSVAAVRESLLMLGQESSFDLNIDIVAEGVGPLTRTDIEMARESNAAVFCFDIKNNDKSVLTMAEDKEVSIHEYDVIYSLLDEAKELFSEYLPPQPVETVHGRATVQQVFSISGGKETIAGLKVLDGHLHKTSVEADKQSTPVHFRVIRSGERISPEGETVQATTLKKFKEDVNSVRQGEECGLSLSGVVDYEEGDVIECYSIKMTKSFA